jgi:N-methylhydantoinase A
MEQRSYSLGCDIGGTFTDFILVCNETGEAVTAKVLTTPANHARAVVEGIDQLEARLPGCLEKTDRVIHGTTLVINAVVQRNGARTALLATEGFRDVLAMRRHARASIYQLEGGLPRPLVPRCFRLGVPERMRADGGVHRPLELESVRETVRELTAQGVESVAVAFLHSYKNPEHERAAREVIAEVAPELAVSLSSDVLPEIREFERTSTTVVNAYVQPLVQDYLGRLEQVLHERGFDHQVFLMQSGGGLITVQTANDFPVRLIESGPVGGVIAAQHYAEIAGGGRSVLAFDMGGTTAKACYIEDGRLPMTSEFEVDRQYRFQKGSGTPVAVPTIDLTEIGAGGGSIASINQLGLLQVGPNSAGAAPGPVCYARGGTEPTVTDADLVLGYLDPGYFLGGAMVLDLDAARQAVERVVARPLDLDATRAAYGIHDLVNENMAAAIRAELAITGGDITRAMLVATGGAGPVHAFNLARKLDVQRLLVPPNAGVGSAVGLLLAPTSFDVMRSYKGRLGDADLHDVGALWGEMEAEAAAVLAHVDPDEPVRVRRFADAAYVGQAHEVRVALPDGPPSREAYGAAFLRAYQDQYGYSYEDVDVELVTLRLHAWHEQPRSGRLASPPPPGAPDEIGRPTRMAYSAEAGEPVPHAVHRRRWLAPGEVRNGPAIIEEPEATTVVGAGASFEVLGDGAILITLGAAA